MQTFRFISAFFVFAAALGCNSDEEIRQYVAPKPPKSIDFTTTRFLGAVIPAGTNSDGKQESWFVRLSGPAYQIEGLDKDFDEFLKSLKLSEQNQLTWTAPANWKELPGNANRLVTFKKTHNGAEHELYISTPFGGTNLENINRWRVQFVGLTAVDELGLPSVTTTFKIGNVTALKVDMVGPGPKGNPRGMMR